MAQQQRLSFECPNNKSQYTEPDYRVLHSMAKMYMAGETPWCRAVKRLLFQHDETNISNHGIKKSLPE